MKIHYTGLRIGLTFGVLDCLLFALAGPVKPVDLASALVVWATVGWAVHASADMPVHASVKGVLIAWLFNIPWGLEFVVIHGQQDLLIPIFVIATLFGAGIGMMSQWTKRKSLEKSTNA